MTISSAPLEAAQALVAAIALGLCLVALPTALVAAARTFDGRQRRWLFAAVVVAALLRWVIAPLEMVTAFVGFKLTEHAISLLPIPHYGVGATALYHALFTFLPADHRTIMAANAVMGVAAVPLAGAWAARLLSDRSAGLLMALLVAVVPLFVRNDTSDALQVPLLLGLLAGATLLAEHVRTGAVEALAGATPLLLFAAITRPEGPLLVALVVAVTLLAPGGGPRLRWALLLGAGAVIVAASTPHLLHCRNAIVALRAHGGLPAFDVRELWGPSSALLQRDVLLRPLSFPVGLTALGLLALARRGPGRRAVDLALALGALVAVAVTAVDLDEGNIDRVQTPAALLWTVLAAGGAARLGAWMARLGARAERPAGWRRALPWAVVAAALATGLPTVGRLFADSNEATEERLIRASLEVLPEGPYTLVRLGEEDRREDDPGSTHVHFPDYLFRPPARQGTLRSAASFLADPDLSRPAYFFWGMRCYARFRTHGTPPMHGTDEHPACGMMRGQYGLVAVVEWEVPNRGDVRLPLYGDAPVLRVGLYRILTVEQAGANRLSR